MNTKKNIVVIGGGTGTHTVLTGLKAYRDTCDLAAVVAMTDSGGSTGRLRDEFGYLPVGDVRLALAALANEDSEHEALIRKLFLHRFATNGDVAGHNFGNLFLVALTDILGSEEAAIAAAARVLNVCGRVIPVTNEKVHLVAEYEDGKKVDGEHDIDEPKQQNIPGIRTLSLDKPARITDGARKVIANADLIVLGPGDLYTSILANCVVDGVREAIANAEGKVLYIPNLMTKTGQTIGKGVAEHVDEISKYAGRTPDLILVNSTPFPEALLERYAAIGESPVEHNYHGRVPHVVSGDFIASHMVVPQQGDLLKRSLIRHDPHKIAAKIVEIVRGGSGVAR